MPYKVNETRRHRIPKARYRVQNWRDYDAVLRRCGDLTVWVTPAAMAAWTPPRCGRRGRPQQYSAIAIETGMMLRLAFGRTWRKLHLAVDPDTGEIVASELTATEDGDASQVGPLLDQISGPIASVTADGAYAGEPVYRTIAERDPAAAVIIPPRSTAVPSNTAETAPTRRDRHLQMIQARGRFGWQKAVNYGRRSLGEVAMMRDKALIGRRLHARTLPMQKTEAAAGCKVINVMTRLGMPVSQRIT